MALKIWVFHGGWGDGGMGVEALIGQNIGVFLGKLSSTISAGQSNGKYLV